LKDTIAVYNAEVDVYNAKLADVDSETGIPRDPVSPEDTLRLTHKSREIREWQSRLMVERRLAKLGAMGQFYEFSPLRDRCWNHTVHEKILKGGTAVPVQHNVLFLVCPFRVVLQRTVDGPETPGDAGSKEWTTIGSWMDMTIENGTEVPALDPTGTLLHSRPNPHILSLQHYRVAAPASPSPEGGPRTSDGTETISRHPEVPPSEYINVVGIPVHHYVRGEPCWNGPARSAKLVFACGPRDEVDKVFENGLCSYEILMSTPSACHDDLLSREIEALSSAERREQWLHGYRKIARPPR
jgi:hypothetical protein